MKLEKDPLRKLTKSLFSGSKTSYLEDLVFPEMANKLQYLTRRTKINTQVLLAEEEFSRRKTTDNLTQSKNPVVTSFSTMSTTELELWISEMKENLKTPQRPSLVRVGGQSRCLSLPETPEAFNFSFVTYDNQLARLTCLQMERTKFLYRHPINLSSYACLGMSLPLAIDIDALSGQQPLHSSDDVRESIALSLTVVDSLFFLSYGTYKIDLTLKNNTLTIDSSTQTPLCCTTQTETAVETEAEVGLEIKMETEDNDQISNATTQ